MANINFLTDVGFDRGSNKSFSVVAKENIDKRMVFTIKNTGSGLGAYKCTATDTPYGFINENAAANTTVTGYPFEKQIVLLEAVDGTTIAAGNEVVVSSTAGKVTKKGATGGATNYVIGIAMGETIKTTDNKYYVAVLTDKQTINT